MLGLVEVLEKPNRPPRFCGVVALKFIGPEMMEEMFNVFTLIVGRICGAIAPWSPPEVINKVGNTPLEPRYPGVLLASGRAGL